MDEKKSNVTPFLLVTAKPASLPGDPTLVIPTTGLELPVGERQALIPPGEYKAQVVEIRPGMYRDKRPLLHFIFEIAEGEHAGVRIRGFVNTHYKSFSAYTKLFEWYSKIKKEPPSAGEKIVVDDFFGKVLGVKVETKVSKTTKNNFSNVTEILGVFWTSD